MTAEQLQAARAAHWRQNQSPILTLDEAEHWLEQHPLCLYLPRRAQLPAPAPSFVEACTGSTQATPGAAAIEQAQGLLTRLIAQGSVVALNLLGGVSEQPDFLVTSQALPYVLCLRADPDWKHAPQKSSGHKVSPLVLELWKALDKDGGLTATEARETLGRELTEAAILRALCELWQALRISPVFAEPGQPARWELLRVRHRDALTMASATGQVTALSLLVSMYLQSVYAASSEEIEIFLSPVASRSRVREAVRGLSATRQIHSLSMDAQTYYFLENGLPEFAELAAPSAVRTEPPAAAAKVEAPRRPWPAQTPGPRRDQAARPVRPVSPPGFRSGRPPGRPAPPAPGATPEARPAAASPPPRTEWNGPRRPKAPWQKSGKPPARGAPWRAKDASARPAPPQARSFSPAEGRRAGKTASRPGRDAGAERPAARPDTRGGARDSRPGAWPGAQKRERPAPWARPGQVSPSASRPPHGGGRGDEPFRPGQKPRPAPRPGSRPSSRAGSGGGRGVAPGRPPAAPPAPAGNRPWIPGRSPGRPAATFRPGQARSGPRLDDRPRGGPAGPRSGPPRGAGSSPGSSSGRNTSYTRSRPAGFAKPGERSDRGEKAAPSAPGSRPPKAWPRAGTASGKPSGRPGGRPGGKPGGRPSQPPASFHGRKPARKKPGP